MSKRQLDAFADTHAYRIPFDTSPRHLAGPGDARHVTHGLAAAGWVSTSDPLSAEIVMCSPDHRYSMQFDPQSATSAWWRLRAKATDTDAGWYSEFGELVPAEILAHFADALVTVPPAQNPDPFEILENAGWQLNSVTDAQSPDGLCRVHRIDPDDHFGNTWDITAHQPGYGTPTGPRIWHASIDGLAPVTAVAGFVTALADRAPLQRGMYDHTAYYAVQKPSDLSPEQIVAAHTARLDRIRRQVSAVRRSTRPSASPAHPSAPRQAIHR